MRGSNVSKRVTTFDHNHSFEARECYHRHQGIITSGWYKLTKLLTVTLENAMQKLEWNKMGVKVDGLQLRPMRFADDIVQVMFNGSQAEQLLAEFEETYETIGVQLNLRKTMFMRNMDF
ncbi:hypothetical protein RB195_015015 [Necator americanus]|uniref:Reverse transcriptase domain-containing protein n=1 Tax=Necator americanus TaxID=51031 RepID=A0ABR1E2R6_NECAM